MSLFSRRRELRPNPGVGAPGSRRAEMRDLVEDIRREPVDETVCPPGVYVVERRGEIKRRELTSGRGHYWHFEVEIIEGPYTGRYLWVLLADVERARWKYAELTWRWDDIPMVTAVPFKVETKNVVIRNARKYAHVTDVGKIFSIDSDGKKDAPEKVNVWFCSMCGQFDMSTDFMHHKSGAHRDGVVSLTYTLEEHN